MAVLLTPPYLEFADSNGNPLSGGKIHTYVAGTTTPKPTYTTSAGDTQHTNPVILDSAGRVVVFGTGSYKFVITDSNDNVIKTVDNVTTFTTVEESENAYFQSFSGDGTTTAFVLSTDLGVEEKSIFVYVDNSGFDYVTNGDFATDSDWTKGSGWTIGSGVATATTASSSLSQDSQTAIEEGVAYTITYTITRSAGTITPSIGGTDGTARSADGTYSETIICGSSQQIDFTGAGFTGTLDNVTIKLSNGKGYEIQNPNSYTLSGTTLSMASAPANGVNNIFVFAPALLANQASASAEAAETAEAGALAAQSAAENAAQDSLEYSERLSGTSATSNLIELGSKSFTTESGKFFDAGNFLLIVSDANESNYMHGQVTAYSGTSLTVDVQTIGGSGTYADWSIKLSSIKGEQGAAGSIGDISGVDTVTPTIFDTLIFSDVDDSNTTKKATTVNVVGATLLDEDDMSSDSSTRGATQQSIKAYVDGLLSTYAFSSTGNTITSAGLLTIAHGLGFAPTAGFIVADLTCTTTDGGWAVNDTVKIELARPEFGASTSRGCMIWADSTNIYVRFGSASTVFTLLNKTTGSLFSATNANWEFNIYYGRYN